MSAFMDLFVSIGLLGFLALGFGFLVAFAVFVFFYFNKGKRPDSVEILFRENVELCRVNFNRNLRVLWLVDLPPMFHISESIDGLLKLAKVGSTDKISSELLTLNSSLDKLFSKYSRAPAIFKGRIEGSNVLNRQVILDEILASGTEMPNKSIRVVLNSSEQFFSPDEISTLKESIALNGANLNMIYYERVIGSKFFGLMAKKAGFIVCAYDNQILFPGLTRSTELSEAAGDVSLLGPGTERFGRFEFLTGYPQNSKFMATEMKCLTFAMVNRQLLSNMGGIVDDALSMNVGYKQGTMYKELDRPIQQQKEK